MSVVMWYLFCRIRDWFYSVLDIPEHPMPKCKPPTQLDRVERHLEHIHEMQHFLFEAVHELLVSGQDMARLAVKAAEMRSKTDALKAAIASVNNTLPAGV